MHRKPVQFNTPLKALEKLAEDGLKAELELLDITDKTSRQNFVEAIKSKYGEVHCLVNNAGFAFKQAATEPIDVQAKITCDINYFGTRDLTKEMLSLFRPGSRIVNVASLAGSRALEQMNAERRHRLMSKSATEEDINKVVEEFIAACEKQELAGWPSLTYGLAKAALIALTAAWARKADKCPEVSKGEGMIITSCCPGWCKTDLGGWEAPPLTAADGANQVGSLALGATKEHHGKFISEGKIIDLRED
ncbi:carbonyl reductase, putative [Eimeria mitis]|uniref:Carbonyl reductase, putative n=1 Tax=Eimeria mitis TaxID=44415 RepID=U6K5F0_9EIME|nr:carbonyl reductase, putative [Eimeria mitis]CDJ33005.1 carbonyl reductase, putative [Eimeria mitis]